MTKTQKLVSRNLGPVLRVSISNAHSFEAEEKIITKHMNSEITEIAREKRSILLLIILNIYLIFIF